MADSYIAIDEPSVVDKKLDTESITVGANTVERERVRIAGLGATDLAPVDSTFGVAVRPPRSATGTVSSVGGSAASVTVLASNANRVAATFFNDSTANAYLAAAASASATTFTKKLLPGDFFVLPAWYTGIVTALWDSATGNMRVTEFT